MTHDQRPSAGLVLDPRSAPPDRRVDVAVMLSLTLLACAAYVVALSADRLPSQGMAVVFFAAVPVCAVFALVVLAAEAGSDDDPALGWVASGTAVAVVAMVLQLVSFPAVVEDGGLLGTSAQASASLYVWFHLAFVAGTILGALSAPPRWQVPSVVVGCLAAVLLATDVVPLPVLLDSGAGFTRLLVEILAALAVLASVALLLWTARVGRSATAPHGWVAVALALCVFDVLFNALADERFSPVWWVSLSFRVATYLVLALGVLGSVLRRWRELATHTEEELDRREGQLRGSLSVTAGLLASAEDLSRAIGSSEVGEALSARALSVAGADYASVALARPGEPLRVLGVQGYDAWLRMGMTRVDWDRLAPSAYVLSLEAPVFLDQAEQIGEQVPDRAGLPVAVSGALAALPIRVNDQTIGVLTVWSAQSRAWSTDQRRVLAGIAVQGGQAIERAQAYEMANEAARTLQESLLPPRLPQTPRLEVAARYVPASDTHLVGGDWYDCLVLPEDRVALVVGDVMGKGLRAAAQMGQIRMAVRSLAALDPSPAAVLTALDEVNLELLPDEIVTVLYVLLDTTSGEALIARAGHLPPALVGPDGELTFVEAGGSTPLGLPVGPRVEAAFTVASGSLLVLFTDGLVEERSTGVGPGLASLTECLRERPTTTEPISDLAERILATSSAHAGEDDIALLLARFV